LTRLGRPKLRLQPDDLSGTVQNFKISGSTDVILKKLVPELLLDLPFPFRLVLRLRPLPNREAFIEVQFVLTCPE
jgi:hypothetical protein